jgi:hypothetical protein
LLIADDRFIPACAGNAPPATGPRRIYVIADADKFHPFTKRTGPNRRFSVPRARAMDRFRPTFSDPAHVIVEHGGHPWIGRKERDAWYFVALTWDPGPPPSGPAART